MRILLSAYSDAEATIRSVQVTHQFLSKPWDADVLHRVIERALDLESILDDEALRTLVSGMGHLPTLPRVYAELSRLLARPETTFEDVARVVERDTGLTARLLHIVNSAFFGLARTVTDLDQAVGYLGIAMVRDLALSTEVFRPLDSAARLRGFDVEAEQRHALLVTGLARVILAPEDPKAAEEAHLAGLLHDIGKLLLAWKSPEQYTEIVEQARREKRPRWQVESQKLGTTHSELGAYLLGLWGMPYSVVLAVAHHHRPERAAEPALDVIGALHVAEVLVGRAWHEAGGRDRGEPATLSEDWLRATGLRARTEAWQEVARRRVAQALDVAAGPDRAASAGR